MKIHIYADAISRKNGGVSILDLFNALQDLGHQVKIFTFFGKLDHFYIELKISIVTIKFTFTIKRF